jgi:hypothetical protein
LVWTYSVSNSFVSRRGNHDTHDEEIESVGARERDDDPDDLRIKRRAAAAKGIGHGSALGEFRRVPARAAEGERTNAHASAGVKRLLVLLLVLMMLLLC